MSELSDWYKEFRRGAHCMLGPDDSDQVFGFYAYKTEEDRCPCCYQVTITRKVGLEVWRLPEPIHVRLWATPALLWDHLALVRQRIDAQNFTEKKDAYLWVGREEQS